MKLKFLAVKLTGILLAALSLTASIPSYAQISPSGGISGFPNVVDIKTARNKVIVIEGDSIPAGASGWTAQLPLINGAFGQSYIVNVATSGETSTQVVSQYTAQVSPYAPRTPDSALAVLQVGTNDINTGIAAATIYNNLKSWWASARTSKFKVMAFTVTPCTCFDAGEETVRQTLNASILSDPTLYDYLIRPDLVLYDASNTAYYPDGIHPNSLAAATKIAELVNDAVTIPPFLVIPTANSSVVTNRSNLNLVLNPGGVGVGIDVMSPGAALEVKAGTTSLAPIKLNSGSLLTSPVVGTFEFLTDAYYGTITTGAARKTFAFLEGPAFTTQIAAPQIVLGTSGILVGGTNAIDQRNSTAAQAHYLYETYIDASNYGRMYFKSDTGNSVFTVGTEKLGSPTARSLSFTTNGVNRWYFHTGGNFLAWTHNTYDIGTSTSANAPRTVYAATSVVTPVVVHPQTGGAATIGNAVLVGGTVTVSTTAIDSSSYVFLQRKTSGGTIGTSTTYTISNGVSFTITSDNILDTSTFSWHILKGF